MPYSGSVVAVVEGWFLVGGGGTHAFEVAAIKFLTSHHDPHRDPVGHVNRLHDPGNLLHSQR